MHGSKPCGIAHMPRPCISPDQYVCLWYAPCRRSTLFTQGHASDVPAKLRQDLKPTLVANWKVWVPFQFINFRFVPQSMQVRTLCRSPHHAWALLGTHMLGNCMPGRILVYLGVLSTHMSTYYSLPAGQKLV